jgi:hypothetical protein
MGATSPPTASAALEFQVGGTADRLLLDSAKLLVNPGGCLISITPEDGFGPGTYDLIDFQSGQASGLNYLGLATNTFPGYALRLQSMPTAEQLVVTAVPEPSTLSLSAVLIGGLAVMVRRIRKDFRTRRP